MSEGEPGELVIRLLGPFAVWVEGKPLPSLRSVKGQWLLALLVLRHGREVSRAWLAEMLWPDSLQAEALTSLRQSLSNLRRALGHQAYRLGTPTTRQVTFDLSGADVDVLRFDQAVTHGHAGALREAIGLYRGALLEGCAEGWALREREGRQQAYLRALETLATQALADGQEAEAAHLLRLGADLDPFQQGLHRNLMQALAKGGDIGEALETYLRLRARLRREHNADPDPETTRLYQQLRAQARRQAQPRSEPPPDSPAPTPPCHVPVPLTDLLGREQALREIEAHLLTHRLVTLTGTGGAGKTRLAIEVCRRTLDDYPEGAWFVDLSALNAPYRVALEVATTLNVREEQGRNWPQRLSDFLADKRLLLVLDNCEHLVEACAELARTLLQACPHLRVLATSRQKLGLMGEVVWQAPPLPVPARDAPHDPEALMEYAAVQLFVERARTVSRSFPWSARHADAVAEICRRLDGLPLAIELAAGLVEILSPQEIALRLEHRFDLLQGADPTRPLRQQTLRAMIDWSYDLLSADERALLRRLSVFRGGWTLQAAEALCKAEAVLEPPSAFQLAPVEVLHGLRRLVGKSLVLTEGRDGETRYRLLESIREYGVERLREQGEWEDARTRHRAFYVALAERAASELMGLEQARWLECLEADHDNFRLALEVAVEDRLQVVSALRLAGALGQFWQIHGYFGEGRTYLNRLLALVPEGEQRLRAQALLWAGMLAHYQGDAATAQAQAEEALTLWEVLEDVRGTALTLGCLAIIAKERGDLEEAKRLFERSLEGSRVAQDRFRQAWSLGYLGILAANQGDYAAARRYYEESLALRRKLRDIWGIAASLNNLGQLAHQEGDYERACSLLEESLAIRRTLEDRRNIAISLNLLGRIACRQGDLAAAWTQQQESLALCWELRDRRSLAYSLEAIAQLALLQAHSERAIRLFAAASSLRLAIRAPLPPAEQVDYAQCLAQLQAQVGAEAFAAAWAEGLALTLEEAVTLAQQA
ncbi:MAG TPA: tetratricopeptide repeat protein [Chthonomonadaceae bacterium]|nr:tetratricopeptide repeat protein [Chthonomonadaceae bacterium]